MALFNYKAVTPSGEVLTGQMDGETEAEIIAKLQEAGNMPISASAADSGFSLTNLLHAKRSASQEEIREFTQQMATLVGAGLPLDRALNVLADLAESERLRELVGKVRDSLRGGRSLSDAIEEQHGVFSKFYINMVRAGEASGTLDATLIRLAEYLERAAALRSSVVSKMIYPIIVLFVAAIAVTVLMVFVIPKFEELFANLGNELPLVTQFVIGVAELFSGYWWLAVAAIALVVIMLRQQFAVPETRKVWDQRILDAPLFGDLVRKLETARLTGTLGTLVGNGVPLLSAIAIGKNVSSNLVIEEALGDVSDDVKTGDPMAHAMTRTKVFPRLALQMISVGEETGRLDEMLTRVADTYDGEVNSAVERVLSVLVPAMIMGLAVVVGVIIVSIMLPMLDMFENL